MQWLRLWTLRWASDTSLHYEFRFLLGGAKFVGCESSRFLRYWRSRSGYDVVFRVGSTVAGGTVAGGGGMVMIRRFS